MVWQDIVITFCTILFGYSLIPQIYYGFKNKIGTITIQTSLLTALGLLVVAFTFFTLGMWFSSAVNVIMAGLWATLLYQRIKYK